MKKFTWSSYLWKIPFCSLIITLGMGINHVALPMTAFKSILLVEGMDTSMIAFRCLAGASLLILPLSLISANIRMHGLIRWFIVAELIWITSILIGAAHLFMLVDYGMVAILRIILYTMITSLVPVIMLSATVTLIFQPIKNYSHTPIQSHSLPIVLKLYPWA